MSSGIWQRGAEGEGVDGFLFADIRKEVKRASKLVRMKSWVCTMKKKAFKLHCGVGLFSSRGSVLSPIKHLNFTFK